MGIAQCKCIETSAEDDDLANATRNGCRQHVFGKSAARRNQQTHGPQRFICGDAVQSRARFVIEDSQRKGVAKDRTAIQRLMHGAISGGTARGLARQTILHRPLL